MATSLARFTICSSHEIIETQEVSPGGRNNHFGGT
jgi:hypothetical protein